ncbi:similar to Saccharomyces cerevisiae YLR221C RSA3 Protein with a likely role in ribosomal maturation, required for accumulation of wild-type levels of large (60S) ribosomal subunits [Maudiozyma barnettii]|uniref:Ribosome assembly protein 3 n=1 Tax=Maudiozyma barnettii TaxID=61262 RepID=A0A8H2ZKG8_9SACH|nr:Rsa3p [Kazachstania barnettii]CAB4255172.1 similar to Saccharomyces cerevisiae YLR221C RSA3 Protein with a likely role in ribosomal maturation, required for accumulation of wild-type levels of large (60S) ribosomal subunits [Kazachstania barnettii]CAD1783443.1 similar to Saccharomyces cerevisiae YLR221C RSA3 Protein with a likely role in ribosomal maturation, required for accumulation of wild-type levels of large (60S) ribosomal subunits [Kazachstania barnettii]
MSAGDIEAVKQKGNKKSRRRKKRRTADSSESESSSSSDNESGTLEVTETPNNAEVSDVELSDNEPESKEVDEKILDNTTKDKLSDIPFTTTQLTQRGSSSGDKKGTIDMKKVGETVEAAKTEMVNSNLIQNAINSGENSKDLKKEYLGLMFDNYGEDINALRNAPDFTNKSLVLLANVLKEGSNMFETDSLKTILESK